MLTGTIPSKGTRLEPVGSNALLADGSEQTVIENASVPANIEGYIDLAEMQVGDTVIIRQHVNLGGFYRLYHEESYNGIQTPPALHLLKKGANSEIKVTLQQTAGINRNYPYDFIREVV